MLLELSRSGCRHKVATEARLETNPVTGDICTGGLEYLEALGVVAYLDTDLLKDLIGVVLDQFEAFV